MSKKFLIGLIVAFVVALALPMVAQAQNNNNGISDLDKPKNCKYVGPSHPLEMNTVSWGDGEATGYTKTVKAQKEIFYCYESFKNIPDDKTLQDPLLNRDKIAKGLEYIVELEIFAFIAEKITNAEPHVDVNVLKAFQVTRCVKKPYTGTHQLNQTTDAFLTWTVVGCEYWGEEDDIGSLTATHRGSVPAIPNQAARGCLPEYSLPIAGRTIKITTKQPFVHGPIPVEDPVETNTVLVDYDNEGGPDWIKTINVNKEVFRCAFSGDPRYPAGNGRIGAPPAPGQSVSPGLRIGPTPVNAGPVIYDIELYMEELQSTVNGEGGFIFPVVYKEFEVAYCAKYEAWADLMGCTFLPNENRDFGQPPFSPVAGNLLPASLRPFISLQSAGLRQSAGQFNFEVQGANIESVQVQVYNTAGRLVATVENAGSRLSWSGLNRNGQRLANGVYLYVMTVNGTYGDMLRTKVQKFAVLR